MYDVRFFGPFLTPSSSPNVLFLPYNVRFLRVILYPPSPLKSDVIYGRSLMSYYFIASIF